MMRRSSLVLGVMALAATAWGGTVEKWVQTTRADFESGEPKGIAILPLGQLALAPELKALLTEPIAHVWALAADPKGTVYAAAGIGAKVLRVQGDKVDTFFTSPEKGDLEVFAVAIAPDGAVLATAAPSGTLYRVTANGKATALYKGTDQYIWGLALSPDGAIYAATGPNGKLLKIAPDGKATTLLTAKTGHLLCVLRAPDGSVYAGADKKGLLYQVTPDGKSSVAYDAGETDIRALAFDPQGRLYFATASGAPVGRPSLPQPQPRPGDVTIRVGPQDQGEREQGAEEIGPPEPLPRPLPPRPGPPIPPGGRGVPNAIYRLAPNGDVAKILTLPVAFYSLAWHDGHLYAGTSPDGKLYRIDDDQPTQLARLDQAQITAITAVGGQLLLATANPGQIQRAVAEHAPSGTFLSDAFDSASHSRWGQIRWDARVPQGTTLTLATRTGNVSQTDATWSPWSVEHEQPTAITSPAARFIQYRATLKTTQPNATPVLDEVVVAFLQANAPPQITQVTIGKPGRQRPPGPSPQPGQEGPSPSLQPPRSISTNKQPVASQRGPFADRVRIAWQAADPNKDELRFTLYYRGEDETTWKKVKDNLTATSYEWDTTAVPDGLYRFRLVASDIGSNPPPQALEKEYITEAFGVDNTPPAVEEVKATVNADRTVTVSARLKDAASPIASAEYAIDGGEWVSLAPTDGVFDAKVETVELKTSPLDKGEHSIVVRAKDEAENTGAGKAVVKVE